MKVNLNSRFAIISIQTLPVFMFESFGRKSVTHKVDLQKKLAKDFDRMDFYKRLM